MAITNSSQWDYNPYQNAYDPIGASRYAQYAKPPMTNLDAAREKFETAKTMYHIAEQAYYAAKAGEPAFCPTKNEINANPALKIAYDEFMIIYKLQKGSK